jgi:hypothetical protein
MDKANLDTLNNKIIRLLTENGPTWRQCDWTIYVYGRTKGGHEGL